MPMRLASFVFVLLAVSIAAAEDDYGISPGDAAAMSGKKVTVKMRVRSSAAPGNVVLNSEEDYKDAKNFAIIIPRTSLEAFRKAKISEPAEYFKGKTILVTGTVSTFRGYAQITVQHPDQIQVFRKK
jgi:DNA/RNA endonuclease YhcR with UshA esterase domain